MARSRGEPPVTMVDEQYPYQIALHSEEVRLCNDEIDFLSRLLGRYRLNRSISVNDEFYVVYMFAEERNAECFLKAFQGEWITSQQRRKGTWVPKYSRMLVGRYSG